MEESYNLDYNTFLLNEAYNQSKMSYIIKSTILINESASIEELEAIREGALDSIKNFISGIIQAIANAWGKFIEWIKSFTSDNKNYLEKNKDIILNKKIKKATFKDWYNYDIARIQKAEIPELNFTNMKSTIESEKPKEDFIAKYFADYKSDKEDESFSNVVKAKLKGEAKDAKETDIVLKDLYEYCSKYDTDTKDKINKEIEMVKKSNDNAYKEIDKLAKELGKGTKQGDIKEESFNYSSTLSYYFGEAEIVDEEPKEDSNDNKSDDKSNNASSDNKDENKSDNKPSNTKEEEFIKTYFTVCSQFLAAKLSVAQEAYKAYMKVIKWHVKKYRKDDEVSDDKKKKDENTEEKKSDNNSEDSSAEANNKALDNAGNDTNNNDNKN